MAAAWRRAALAATALAGLLAGADSQASRSERAFAAVIRDPATGEFTVQEGPGPAHAVAWAAFEDGLNRTGWGVLDIETNDEFEDADQSYAAGMLEGYLTAPHIYKTARNLAQAIFKKFRMPHPVKEFMDKQEEWARSQIDSNPNDPFWRQVGYLMRQYDGLVDGYVMRTPYVPFLGSWAFAMLNGVGDLFDIMPAVQESARNDYHALNASEAEFLHATQGHCSALIKVLGDFSDIFVAHSSWYTFSNTDRIMKHYRLNFRDESTAARKVSFSSYPGFLESLDDFYMLGSGLVWTQTSNAVIDHSVYAEVKPEALLAWQRVRVASAMAHSGEEWFNTFKRHFSGTYANQYMVVDMKRFTPGQPLADGTLWVAEEMPGLVVGKDQTAVLRLGYWPSYNMPFYPEVYEKAGYPAMAAEKGTYWTYSLNPRGKIFRRDQGKVTDLASLKALMRSNDFEHDPYSFDGTAQNAMYAICSRGDLSAQHQALGCYDTKVTSYAAGGMQQRAEIVNGPTSTSSGGELPPFRWAGAFDAQASHLGLPSEYAFDFIQTAPRPVRADPALEMGGRGVIQLRGADSLE